MSNSLSLSLDAARALVLAAQGLEGPAYVPSAGRPATKDDVRSAIQRMGALQIDTIHVVARSPYLVLWSRLGDYDPCWLEELLAETAIFEHWSHAECFLPIEDYPLYRRLTMDGLKGWSGSRVWLAEHPEVAERVLGLLRERGPVRSNDFPRTDGQTGGWWNWKPEKMALEVLHALGDLMIARRHNFHRIYDLRERVLPDWDDSAAPPIGDVQRALIDKTVKALGLARREWITDYFRLAKRGGVQRLKGVVLDDLIAEGAVVAVEVQDWPGPAFVHRDNLALAEAAADGTLCAQRTTLLSPFDPVVWDRARASEMWGFDYLIECYTPAAKRRYGYFTLPILHQGRLVGRLDPKAHRKEGQFEVKALHLEPGVEVKDELVAGLAGALVDCARWHGTPEVVVRWANVAGVAEAVEGQSKGR